MTHFEIVSKITDGYYDGGERYIAICKDGKILDVYAVIQFAAGKYCVCQHGVLNRERDGILGRRATREEIIELISSEYCDADFDLCFVEPIDLDTLTAKEIKKKCFTGDQEHNHAVADVIIEDLLEKIGYTQTLEALTSVRKWYA